MDLLQVQDFYQGRVLEQCGDQSNQCETIFSHIRSFQICRSDVYACTMKSRSVRQADNETDGLIPPFQIRRWNFDQIVH